MTKTRSTIQKIGAAAIASSQALAAVGHWIVAHPLRTIAISAEELAAQAGASLAAVNRFSKNAGFDGFADLKTALSEELHDASEPINKLRTAATADPSSTGDSQSFDGALANLRLGAQLLETEPTAQAASRLLAARMVYTLGFGLGNIVASAAAHLLLPYVKALTHVAGEGGTEVAARRLVHVGPSDALLVVSLPRYSRDTLTLAKHAKDKGAYIAVITDRPGSPLAIYADALFLAPSDHAVLPSSTIAAMAMVEVLTGRIMRLNPDAARVQTELSEIALEHFSTNRKPTDR